MQNKTDDKFFKKKKGEGKFKGQHKKGLYNQAHTHTIYHPDRGQRGPYESTRTGLGCPTAGRGNDQCTQPRELGQMEDVRVWRRINKTLEEKKNGRVKLKNHQEEKGQIFTSQQSSRRTD